MQNCGEQGGHSCSASMRWDVRRLPGEDLLFALCFSPLVPRASRHASQRFACGSTNFFRATTRLRIELRVG
jgi:hypothetical protein